MPLTPKPPERRQRRNARGDAGLLVIDGTGEVPSPSKKWAKRTVTEWDDFWDSPLATLVVMKSDLPAIRRLFDYRDELRRAMRAYRKQRTTEGSMKQLKLSPMADAIVRLEKLVAPLEDRFGMTPMSRLKLGATLGDASKSLAEMNAALDAEVDDDDDDPRFDVIDANTSADERAEGM